MASLFLRTGGYRSSTLLCSHTVIKKCFMAKFHPEVVSNKYIN
jgi:hypothetical protein